MSNSTRNTTNRPSRTPSRVKNTTSPWSRGRGPRESRGSGSRLGGTGHVEVIPFRPHHSWWVQLLLLIWRWTLELLLVASIVWYWRRTAMEGWPGWVQLTVPAVVLAALLTWPLTRRWVLGVFWLLVTRHRLRQYFLQCGAYNRSGRLPWLTLAYPTPVGERVWVWLVAGLSLADFESDTTQIAVACWARDCRVGRSKRLAGLVWVDIVRRDPLTASQPYPSTLLTTDTLAPAPSTAHLEEQPVSRGEAAAEAPVVVLPRAARDEGPLDVPRTVINLDALRTDTPAANGSGSGRRNSKPAARRTGTDTGPDGASAPVTPIVGRGGEDVSDWL
jgi:hypothetical protein